MRLIKMRFCDGDLPVNPGLKTPGARGLLYEGSF